jgi:hypothetical protein
MSIQAHEGLMLLGSLGPSLGYLTNVLVGCFGRKKNVVPPSTVNETAVRNYELAVARLKRNNPGFEPSFTSEQLLAAGDGDYASTLSLLQNPNQEAARRLKGKK